MRTATIEDFKVGTELIDKEDAKCSVTIVRKEDDGVWVGRNRAGDRCIFECESNCYWFDDSYEKTQWNA